MGIVAEKALLMKCPPMDAPIHLLTAYNIKYPEELDNFFLFMEYILLEKAPPKKCQLAHFITYIHPL